MRCLVTGVAGFIGSHVADHLLRQGHDVWGLDDLSGGFLENVDPRVKFTQGSILDHQLIEQLFAENTFDYVFHLAAYAAEGLSHFIKRFNYENNLIGSVNLINSAVNSGTVKCFVFTSSIAVYGGAPPPVVEDTIPRPEDPYGIAKFAVEMDLAEAHHQFGLDYMIFRPHNVYGERQNIGDPYRNVIGIFMNQILKGAPLTVFGDGKQTRAFSYIDDVAPVIAGSVDCKDAYNQIFNIGADKPYSVLELAETVQEVMGAEVPIRFLEARNEVIHAFSSHDKVRHYFSGLEKNTSLRDGLERMAAWVQKAGAKQGKPFGHVEVAQNMPASWAQFTLEE
jgi:UDP-glucose 4-epimerase